jgi:error-prone DNA polymerase
MYEIVRYCREHEILCQGRGSAANSAVCFCLGITAVDPVRVNLLFERFISRERAEPPDIDLDIEHRRREEVIEFVYERYGRDRAAMLANVVRYRRRSAIRDVGKTFGFPETMLDQISKLLSHRGMSIPEAVAQSPLDERSPNVASFLSVCEQILDMPRHLSINPGGFLLGREPIAHIVPIENATMPGRTVIQWDKYAVEAMNLFKVDLLGLGALTHLDYAFRLLREHLGVRLEMATIPPGCAATYAMLRRADTVGVFQLESRAQMAMLPRLKPQVYYDLVIEISIVRPGPITGGMVHPFLRRRAGEETVEYPHPDLEHVLAKTLGVPLFQEQVMKLAVVAADYTPGEADRLRRDMAAWRHTGRIEEHHEKLVKRMIAKGIEHEFAERVFDQIRGFGEYGFPESHAASFALIAYATAWMRANYPVVFTCALLRAWPMGFYSPASIVADAIRHGITVLPIDLLESEWECSLVPNGSRVSGHATARGGTRKEPRTPDARFAIRMGLRYVKGIGPADWDRITAARKRLAERRSGLRDAVLETLREFLRIARLPQDLLVSLAQAGAFSSFRTGRRDSAWEVFARDIGLAGRWNAHEPVLAPDWDPDPVRFRTLSFAERVVWDYRSSAHSTEGHPLEPFRAWLARHGHPSASEVRQMPHGAGVAYVGMVICRQRPETASGTVFFTLEDETGYVNLIVWKSRYARLRSVLVTASVLGVRGNLQSDGSVVHLIVADVWKPRLPENAAVQRSRDFH